MLSVIVLKKERIYDPFYLKHKNCCVLLWVETSLQLVQDEGGPVLFIFRSLPHADSFVVLLSQIAISFFIFHSVVAKKTYY